eukprot:TRINITY_DN9593_c0_g1_i3.p1 TRINITY_DN9593_c0_g1~~TRINITY_DN9593_c0_g1_i3.p1  ORF type:complete len:370 (-),score=74.78 TRINITY_DN9593_c0_g1_i3:83-1159(-)
MEVLQCNGKLGKLRLIEVEKPKLRGPDDVIVKVAFAGICGTDLHILSGEFSHIPNTWVTISHEFSGVVEEIGDNVTNIKVGDRVGVDPNRACLACKYCRRGQVQHCQNKGARDSTGVFHDGGMASHCVVIADQVHKLPEGVSLQQGALCEPLSCLLHGWNRLQKSGCLQADSRILVIGAGIIGNLWVSMLHHNGYRDVTVSEPAQGRRDILANLETGYKVLTPAEVEAEEEGKDAELDGFDVVIECSGFPPAIEKSVAWTSRGAALVIFGCSPRDKPIKLCPEEVYRKELMVIGCLINPFTYSKALKLADAMGERYLSFERLGVQIFKLKEYETALTQLKSGGISKAVFNLNNDLFFD